MMSYDDVILHNMLMYTQLEAGNWGKTVIILMYTAVYITCTAKWCTSVQYTAIHWILQYKVIQYAVQGGPGKKIHHAVCSTPKFGENIVSYRIVTTLVDNNHTGLQLLHWRVDQDATVEWQERRLDRMDKYQIPEYLGRTDGEKGYVTGVEDAEDWTAWIEGDVSMEVIQSKWLKGGDSMNICSLKYRSIYTSTRQKR